MRRALALAAVVVAAALASGARAQDGPPPPVLLESPAAVEGLRVADVDGDGLADVLVVVGRQIRGWRGARDGAIRPAPTWTWTVPEDATFACPAPALKGAGPAAQPALLAVEGRRVVRLVPGAPPAAVEGLEADLAWSAARSAVLADFARGATLLLPTSEGLHWVPDAAGAPGAGYDLPAAPARRVTPPGPFVEDAAVLTTTWPAPVLVRPRPADGPGAVYALGSDALHAFTVEGGALRDRAWPTDFLPREGDQRLALVDLDGDGVPDLCHEATTNDSGTYSFFRTPAGPPGAAARSDLRPPRSVIRLRGFQITPDYVDLDGDGRPDFVVTTIDIDGTNVLRAVMQGRVVARTRAFMNRSRAGGGDLFPPTPDAEVESDIGVRILFTFSGSIEVRRSYTILATADVDGDGRKDLVIRTGPATLSVRRGVAEGVWAKEAHEVAIPPVGGSPDVEGYVGDVTGDGRDDLVLLYKAPPRGADRIAVVVSR